MESPAGSNELCQETQQQGRPRIRKEWKRLTEQERELLVSTLETAIERQRLPAFLDYHTNVRSAFQSHATCGFALWHRRYLLAVEDMLRDIDPPRTSCLTIPYWDISIDFYRQNVTGSCFSVASCAPGLFLHMMGGVPGFFSGDDESHLNETSRQFSTLYTASGALLQGRPVSALRDDLGRPGLIRTDLFRTPLPPTTSAESLRNLILQHRDYDSFTRSLQRGVHDDVHVSIGGFMPTFASPADVFFWVWHSTIDWLMMLWQSCHHQHHHDDNRPTIGEFMGTAQCEVRPLFDDSEFALGGPPPLAHPGDITLQPSANDDMIIEKKENVTMNIRNDPILGRYFQSVGLRFRDVWDARFINKDSSFTYELVDHDTSIWKSLSEGDYLSCPSTTSLSDLQETFPIYRESETQSLDYPHRDLELLVEEWVEKVFPTGQNNVQQEEPALMLQRRQYLACSIFHTRGTILFSELLFLEDVRTRQANIPDGPERCADLWPGGWKKPSSVTSSPSISPSLPSATASPSDISENLTTNDYPSSNSLYLPWSVFSSFLVFYFMEWCS